VRTRSRRQLLVYTSIFAGLLFSPACKKTAAPTPADPLYTVKQGATPAPVNFVHKTFKVNTSAKFEFDVPPHSVNPKLQGDFKAYASGNREQAASVDLLLLTPDQFVDFSRGTGEPTYAVTGTSGQTVGYALAPTMDEGQKYYLVFRNAGKGSAATVEADFTVSFD